MTRPHSKFIRAPVLRITHKAYLRADAHGKTLLVSLVNTAAQSHSCVTIVFQSLVCRDERFLRNACFKTHTRVIACCHKTKRQHPNFLDRHAGIRSLWRQTTKIVQRQQNAVIPPCCYLSQQDELQHVQDCSPVVREPMCCMLYPEGVWVWGVGREVFSAITEQNDLRLFFHSV